MESLPDNSVVVSVASPIKYMSNNIFYKHRQASDFWYLTGFEEPDSAVILEKKSSSKGYRMTLFCQGKDPAKEKWEGARTGLEEAASIFSADDARSIEVFSSHLKSSLDMYDHVYIDLPSTSTPASTGSSKGILAHLSTFAREQDSVIQQLASSRSRPLAPEVSRLRSVKSPAEQRVMRAAADISGRAHAKSMRYTRVGMPESSVAAHFEYLCSVAGAERPAYVPVVASGANALIIHYTKNNHIIRDGDMILTDAGCEYHGYASDITRTYPANGRFSSPQRDLYSAVLSAQRSLLSMCSEAANVSMLELHGKSRDLLRKELQNIGLEVSSRDLERTLYPHFVGHPIGLDLHESTYFNRAAPLQAGMVVTVEPGIYVPPTSDYPKAFHNIGIRIEDEVLVGKEHPVVLSVTAPKEVEDVEGACQGLLGLEAY